MILVCGSQLCHGVKLECGFGDVYYFSFDWLYSCKVTSLDNPNNNLNIDGYSGYHKANKNDADVKGILIHETNTKYIPLNLGSLFNLTALHMVRTQLVEIKATDVHGMQDLEELNFWDNKLSSVPLDAFTTLTKLKYIFLTSNQIEELPNGIFNNNLELNSIHLEYNKIKYLGAEIFNNLKELYFVGLDDNICVSKNYYGATEINQLKDDIKMKCKNPNEVPAMATTTTRRTTTTTQNPMEVKLIEMQEKNRKLEEELREAKEQQQTNEDALKKELWKPRRNSRRMKMT